MEVQDTAWSHQLSVDVENLAGRQGWVAVDSGGICVPVKGRCVNSANVSKLFACFHRCRFKSSQFLFI